MKTYSPRPEHIERRWYVLDAGGQVLGRVASEAATLLRGKHKPIYAPHMDTGDHVIIVNADKVELSAGKELKKFAYRHSGHPGGITAIRYDRLMAERPVFVIEKAVRGMLPKNRLGRAMFRKLHVVAGAEHPHAAQRPVALRVGDRPEWPGLPGGASPAGPETTEAGAKAASKPKPTPKAAAAKRPTARAAATKRTPAKPAARKPAATKAKPAAKKPAAKKPAAKKPAAKKTSSAAGSSAGTKTTAKKSTARRPARADEE